ncbi:hypothetical protein FIBSPDRAFT_68356 [Athelia psychrophila]|uniref:Uncharacterized protein n=1 Tax=Athelia psychrophila TaxID=1759441 RepID=A0A166EQM3_9AGAM|nr:hypothetical protein FIBSPDRAFT_68356 [Fibularhizoctonia sp. CBS 109695]
MCSNAGCASLALAVVNKEAIGQVSEQSFRVGVWFKALVHCSHRGLSMRVSNTPLDISRRLSDDIWSYPWNGSRHHKKCWVTIIGVEKVDNKA